MPRENTTPGLPPHVIVRNRLRGSGWSATDRLVALIIALNMPAKSKGDMRWGVWALSYAAIASEAGVDPSTVKRSVKRLCDGPTPMFARKAWGTRNPAKRRIYQYHLVVDPVSFAEARDRVRAKRAAMADATVGRVTAGGSGIRTLDSRREEMRENFQALKADLSGRWGRGEISDGEYQKRLEAAEKAFRDRALFSV